MSTTPDAPNTDLTANAERVPAGDDAVAGAREQAAQIEQSAADAASTPPDAPPSDH